MAKVAVFSEYDFALGNGACPPELRPTAPMPFEGMVFMMNNRRDQIQQGVVSTESLQLMKSAAWSRISDVNTDSYPPNQCDHAVPGKHDGESGGVFRRTVAGRHCASRCLQQARAGLSLLQIF